MPTFLAAFAQGASELGRSISQRHFVGEPLDFLLRTSDSVVTRNFAQGSQWIVQHLRLSEV